MTPIRPPPAPLAGAQPQRPDAARSAAQRAFFQLAAGKAEPARAAEPRPASPTAPAHAAARVPDPAAERPAKLLRPGSLLDIRV